MQYSLFFARLLGPMYMIIAAGILFNLKYYQEMIVEFTRNKTLLYFGGILSLIFGLIIVILHNTWTANWTIIITIMGWLGVVKGILLVGFPNVLVHLTDKYKGKTNALKVHLSIIFVLAAILAYMGYFSKAMQVGF